VRQTIWSRILPKDTVQQTRCNGNERRLTGKRPVFDPDDTPAADGSASGDACVRARACVPLCPTAQRIARRSGDIRGNGCERQNRTMRRRRERAADATHDNVTADNQIETDVRPTTRRRQRSATAPLARRNVQQTTRQPTALPRRHADSQQLCQWRRSRWRRHARGRDLLLLLLGRRRLRRSDTACGTRVRACVHSAQAGDVARTTDNGATRRAACNKTGDAIASRGAEQSDHPRVSKSAHPKANRTHADVRQTTCCRHRAGRQREKPWQRKPSSSRSQHITCSRHDEWNETH
jgi:hypothetical protein